MFFGLENISFVFWCQMENQNIFIAVVTLNVKDVSEVFARLRIPTKLCNVNQL